MWATITAGDLLLVPFGLIVGKSVKEVTYGLRHPLIIKASRQANLQQGLEKKKQEYEAAIAASKSENAKNRYKVELDVITELETAVTAPA